MIDTGLEGIVEDPVSFFKKTAKGLQVKLAGKSEKLIPNGELEILHMASVRNAQTDSEIGVIFDYSDGVFKRHPPYSPMPDEALRYFSRDTGKFSLARHTVDFFGQYSGNVGIYFCLTLKFESYDLELLSMDIAQPKPGVFCAEFGTDNFDVARLSDMGIGPETYEGPVPDYRPFLYRMLELYAGVPAAEWHNPRVYLIDRRLPQVFDYLELVFPEREAAMLKGKMEDARLRLRDNWSSVPRLNLGMKQLPNPAPNLLAYVASGSEFLVESLHVLGIMTPQEARQYVGQRVVNYVMHHTDFQRNPVAASRILAGLRGAANGT
ncbi:hypothetical protein HY640_04360 [Candidatus Woesearchaeota archaeon]|nr:hypothetical protein [Candidatus Woesearchaeota archaeon]